MKTNNSLPIKYAFTLNDKDIRYGIIRISEHKDVFPTNSYIKIICKNEKGVNEFYTKRIPSGGGYIPGLTKQHNNNNATEGTIVEITKTEKGYYLEYKHDKNNGIGIICMTN